MGFSIGLEGTTIGEIIDGDFGNIVVVIAE